MTKNCVSSLFDDIVGSVSVIKHRTVELGQRAHGSYDKCPNVNNALKNITIISRNVHVPIVYHTVGTVGQDSYINQW